MAHGATCSSPNDLSLVALPCIFRHGTSKKGIKVTNSPKKSLSGSSGRVLKPKRPLASCSSMYLSPWDIQGRNQGQKFFKEGGVLVALRPTCSSPDNPSLVPLPCIFRHWTHKGEIKVTNSLTRKEFSGSWGSVLKPKQPLPSCSSMYLSTWDTQSLECGTQRKRESASE